MILTALILGAVVGGIVATFWKNIVAWLKAVVKKVAEVIKRVVIGTKVFLQKVNGFIKQISKNYSQNKEGQWTETIVTKEVSESEVPAEILAKLNSNKNNSVDITEKLELELS